MPKVAGQQYPYTPEGVAAAEAAAAELGEEETNADKVLDEIVGTLPEEGDDLSVEEIPEEVIEPEEVQMPSDEIIAELYETLYGEPFDESEEAQEQFQDLQVLLSEMPELAAAIAAGEISPSEAAIVIFREAASTA